MNQKDKTKTYRERVLEEFDKRFFGDSVPDSWDRFRKQDPYVIKNFISQALDTTISEVLDEVRLERLNDDIDLGIRSGWVAAMYHLEAKIAEIKKGLK